MSIAAAPVATPQRARVFAAATGVLTLVAAATGLVAIAHGAAREQTTALALVTLVAAVSFAISGVIAWRRRPGTLTGPLMVAAGFAMFAGSLANFDSAVPFTIGLIAAPLPAAIIAHLVLSFPDGRLHGRLDRVVVAGAYFVTVVLQVAMLMFMGFGDIAGCPCPTNLLFVRDATGLHAALMTTQRLLGIVLALTAATIVWRRRVAASPPARRALDPILLTGGVTIFLLLGTLVAAQISTTAWAAVSSAERVATALIPIAYLLGLVRARVGRAAVSDLIVELGAQPEPGRLRDALARALHDPSLELAYWVAESGTYIGVDGRHVDPAAASDRRVTVVERRGRRIAALMHDPAVADEPALLDSVATAAGLALENERLLAELRAQLEQLRQSRARIVQAGDTERRRLERNLHDGAQQRLVTLSLALGRAEMKVRDDPETAERLLGAARGDLTEALAELRELARGIHPAVLTERGLAHALMALAERAPVPTTLDMRVDTRPPPGIEAAAYYIVAEALANTGKYAKATAAMITVWTEADRLHVVIADDGIGGADPSAGSGLRGLDDRAQAVGGSLRVVGAPGEGTRIEGELPLS